MFKMDSQTATSMVQSSTFLDECKDGVQEKVQQDVGIGGRGTVLQEFYRDTNVLITGATGFMGKVLVEKLLRGCPSINKIYLLLRCKKGKTVAERLDDIVNTPLFDRLRLECPEFRSKLHAVTGDIALIGLGIGDDDQRLLQGQIHVVFHVAATVRFDESLGVAVAMNVRGTRELLLLARSFDRLKSFVYVSTAYGNCPRKEIDECFYPPPMPSDVAIKVAENIDPWLLDTLTTKTLGPWPNTYAYTKALSEDVIRQHGQDMPVGVFRPAIVVCTSAEPVPGWIDNLYGPTGLIIGGGMGLVRTHRIDLSLEANIVPCDLVINSLIASAWDIAENRSEDIPIYNYVLPRENKFSWFSYLGYCTSHRLDVPLSNAIWYPMTVYTTSKLLAKLYRLLLHYIPALFMDLFLKISGKKTKMLRIYLKIHKFLDVISYFTEKEWTFKNGNIDRLWNKLEPSDQEIFDFNILRVNWKEYIDRTILGMRIYVMKDGLETMSADAARLRKLRFLHLTLKYSVSCLAAWLVWMALNAVSTKIYINFTTGGLLTDQKQVN